MKEINIARAIINKRREKGLTQDDLASYIGVSKASVSKWETGQSYPDITFLPQLAAFFNMSIDELMGYEPQMTKEDIRKLYLSLSADFASKSFDEVLERCRETAKKYFSCFPLLFQIGAMLVNNSMLSGDGDRAFFIIEEAKELFIRVKRESDNAELARQALNMEALCALMLGNPNEVLGLFAEVSMQMYSPEAILAPAYQMIGKPEEAKAVLQVGIYQHVLSLLDILPTYLTLCTDEPERYDETYKRALAVVEAFGIKGLHPSILVQFLLVAAQEYVTLGNTDKALDILEEYAELVTGDIYPLQLKGDDFFNLLDAWFKEFPLGTAPPRDEKMIRQSMTEGVVNNPAFTVLADERRFQRIAEKLKNN